MNAKTSKISQDVLKLEARELPPVRFHEWDSVSSQLSRYFRELILHNQTKDMVESLELPSVIELAVLFHCCEMDVFDALLDLRQHNFKYTITGIDNPIRMWDTFLRKPNRLKRWNGLPTAFLASFRPRPMTPIFKTSAN